MQSQRYFLRRLLAMALAVTLPLLALHLYFLLETSRGAERAANLALQQQADEAARDVNVTLARAESLLHLLARREELQRTRPDCNQLVHGLLTLDDLYRNVGVIAADGRPLCVTASADAMLPTFQERPWFRLALAADGVLLSQPFLSQVSHRPVALLTLSLRDAGGAQRGVLMVSLDLLKLSERMARLNVPPGSTTMLLNPQSQLVGRSPELMPWFGKDIAAFVQTVTPSASGVTATARGMDGLERIYAAQAVGRHGLRVLVGMPAAEIQARQRADLRRSLLAIGGVFVLGIALAWLMGRRLSRPLQSLVDTSRAVAAGTPRTRADEQLPGEFRQLALEFNRMLDAREASLAALRESERRYADLLDNVALAAVAIDLQSRITYCNDYFLKLSGWTRAELIGRDWFEVMMPPERRGGRERIMADVVAGRLPRSREREILTRGGVRRMMRWNYSLQHSATGGVEGVAAIAEDVTEQREAQRLHQEAERRERRLTAFYTALSRTNQLIVRERNEARLLAEICQICVETGHAAVACIYLVEGAFASLAACAGPVDTLMRGVPERYDMNEDGVREAVAARAWHERRPVISANFQADARSAGMRERAASEGIQSAAAIPLFRRGEVGGLLVLVSLEADFFDDKLVALANEMVGDLGYALDNMASARAQAQAEAASRAKTEFLSRMSHELRTPLNAVLGFAHLLHDDERQPLSPRQRHHAQLIVDAGTHLRALIDDVLDVSRIEAGQVTVEQRDVELTGLLDGVLRMSEAHAQEVGIRLLAADAPESLLVRSDPMRLRQVLLNLVSNGIKYNRPGGQVRLAIEREALRVHVDVIDDGLGMTEPQQAQLFEPFNRLGRERSEIEGSGIGLALSRQLMVLMGGELSVHSRLGEGTRVRISLPLAALAAHGAEAGAPEAPAPATPADPALSGKVLYIEDNPVNVLLVQELLSRWPALQLEVAVDGRSGLARAEQLQPDLLLLDMQLPDISGLQVLQRLQAQPTTRHLRVVALSASAMSDEVAAAREAGALDYWTKPLDFERFLAGLRQFLGPR